MNTFTLCTIYKLE